MHNDENAIRDLLARWMTATERGDLPTVLSLMSDDVVFTVPAMPPFGKAAFAAGFMAMQAFRVSAKCNPVEIAVNGDWAYVRNHISVVMTPLTGGRDTKRSGFTLSILRKKDNGSWVVIRDANMMIVEPSLG
jgi:uncharacterized protein (TIGR02246 family)